MSKEKARLDWREGRRRRAWELKEQGWKQNAIAAALGVTPGAVSQWLTRARAQGVEEGLRPHPAPGPTPKLTPEQIAQIPALLDRGAEAYGFGGQVWTCQRVGAVIRRTFGVTYHPAHISRLLHRLGYSVQRPIGRAAQRDEAKITTWAAERWPTHKRGQRNRERPSAGEMSRASLCSPSRSGPGHRQAIIGQPVRVRGRMGRTMGGPVAQASRGHVSRCALAARGRRLCGRIDMRVPHAYPFGWAKVKDHDMLLQACLNGSRTPGEHPALPVTPQDLGLDAQLAVAAGARALHVHPRNAQGMQSLDAQDIADTLSAIHKTCPGIPVGVSTALWIEPKVERRLKRIESWVVQPDYASVNFSEPGVAELCAHFLSRHVGIEAGIWSVADAHLLTQLGLAERCLRILIEVQERDPEAARTTAEDILQYLDVSHVQSPRRLLHGDTDAIAWRMLEMALQRGYDTRIGLEDTLTLPDGRLATDNAELVAAAVRKARQTGTRE